ncbi:MAG: hypothetical protein ACI4L8_05395 [Candidatus Fimadaptatus sp.]
MLKRIVVALALCLALALPALAQEAQTPVLPDISTVLGVEGELYGESEEESGPYHTYRYEADMTIDRLAKVIVAYSEALRTRGFEPQRKTASNATNALYFMTYTCDAGETQLAVFVADGAKELSEGGEGTLWFALAVPDALGFVPGTGAAELVEGGTRCIDCGGVGRCAYCGGMGTYDYGQGQETCVVCDGAGICTVCDGVGSY